MASPAHQTGSTSTRVSRNVMAKCSYQHKVYNDLKKKSIYLIFYSKLITGWGTPAGTIKSEGVFRYLEQTHHSWGNFLGFYSPTSSFLHFLNPAKSAVVLPAVVGSVVLNLSTESSEIFWKSRLRREEPSAGFLVVIGSMVGRVWSATYISINSYFHFIPFNLADSVSCWVFQSRQIQWRHDYLKVLSCPHPPLSQRCIMSSENSYYPPPRRHVHMCLSKTVIYSPIY